MKKHYFPSTLLAGLFAFGATNSQSQNVGINNNGLIPHASAMLDVSSTTKGMLVPRMSAAQRAAIASPAKGLMVYDTDTNGFWFYNGSAWATVGSTQAGHWLVLKQPTPKPCLPFKPQE